MTEKELYISKEQKKKRNTKIIGIAAIATFAGVAIAGASIGLIASSNKTTIFTIASQVKNNISLTNILQSPDAPAQVKAAAKALTAYSPITIVNAVNNPGDKNSQKIINDLKQIVAYNNRNVKGFEPDKIAFKKDSVKVSKLTGELEMSPTYGIPNGLVTPRGTVTGTLSDAEVAKNLTSGFNLDDLPSGVSSEPGVPNAVAILKKLSPIAIVNAINNPRADNHASVVQAIRTILKGINKDVPNFNPNKIQVPVNSANVNLDTGHLELQAGYGISADNASLAPKGVVLGTLADSEVATHIITSINLKNFLTPLNKGLVGYYSNKSLYNDALLLSNFTAYNINNILNKDTSSNAIYKDVNAALLDLLIQVNLNATNGFNPQKLHLPQLSNVAKLNNNNGVLEVKVYYGPNYNIDASGHPELQKLSESKYGNVLSTYSVKTLVNSTQTVSGVTSPVVDPNINVSQSILNKMSPLQVVNILKDKSNSNYNAVIDALINALQNQNKNNKQFNPDSIKSFTGKLNENGQLEITPIYGTTNEDNTGLEDVTGISGIVSGLISNSEVANGIDSNIDVKSNSLLSGMSPIAIANAINNPNNSQHAEVVQQLKNLINNQPSNKNNDVYNPNKLQLPVGSAKIVNGQLEITPSYGMGNQISQSNKSGIVTGTIGDAEIAKSVNVSLNLTNPLLKVSQTIYLPNSNLTVSEAAAFLSQMSPYQISNIFNAGAQNNQYTDVVNALKTVLIFINKNNVAAFSNLPNNITKTASQIANFNPDKLQLPPNAVSINPTTGELQIKPSYGLDLTNATDCNQGTITGTLSNAEVAKQINSTINITDGLTSNNQSVKTAAEKLAGMSPYAIQKAIESGNKEIAGYLKTLIENNKINATNPNFNPNKLQISPNSVTITPSGQLQVTPTYGPSISNSTKASSGIASGTKSDQAVAQNLNTKISIPPSDVKLAGMSPYNIKNILSGPNTQEKQDILNKLYGLYNKANIGNPNYNPNKLKITASDISINPTTGNLEISPSYGNGGQAPQGTVEGTLPDSQVNITVNINLQTLSLTASNPTVGTYANQLSAQSAYQILTSYNSTSNKTAIVNQLMQIITYENTTATKTKNPNFNPSKLHITGLSINQQTGQLQVEVKYGVTSELANQTAKTGTIITTKLISSIAKGINIPQSIANVAGLETYTPIGIKNAVDNDKNPNHTTVINALKAAISNINENNPDFNKSLLTINSSSISIVNGQLVINPTYGYPDNNALVNNTNPTTTAISDKQFAETGNIQLSLNLTELEKNPTVSKAAEELAKLAPINIYNQLKNELSNPNGSQTIVNYYKELLQEVNSNNKNFNINKIQLVPAILNNNNLADFINQTNGILQINPYYGISATDATKIILQPSENDQIIGTLPYKSVLDIKTSISLNQLYNEAGASLFSVQNAIKQLQSINSEWIQKNINNSGLQEALKTVINYANNSNQNYYSNAISKITYSSSNDGNFIFDVTYGYGSDAQTVKITISDTLEQTIVAVQSAISSGFTDAKFVDYTPYSAIGIANNFVIINSIIKNNISELLSQKNVLYPYSNINFDSNNLNLDSTQVPITFTMNLGSNLFTNEPNIETFNTNANGFTSFQTAMTNINNQIFEQAKEGIWINGNIVDGSSVYYLWLPNYYGELTGQYMTPYIDPLNDLSNFPNNTFYLTSWESNFSKVAAPNNIAEQYINSDTQNQTLNKITNLYGFKSAINSDFVTITGTDTTTQPNFNNMQYVSISSNELKISVNWNSLTFINNLTSKAQAASSEVLLKQKIMVYKQINDANKSEFLFTPTDPQYTVQSQPQVGDWVQELADWIPYKQIWFNNGWPPVVIGLQFLYDGMLEFNASATTYNNQPVSYLKGFQQYTMPYQLADIINVNSVQIPEGIKYIAPRSFRKIVGARNNSSNQNNVTVNIPNSVESIGLSAFELDLNFNFAGGSSNLTYLGRWNFFSYPGYTLHISPWTEGYNQKSIQWEPTVNNNVNTANITTGNAENVKTYYDALANQYSGSDITINNTEVNPLGYNYKTKTPIYKAMPSTINGQTITGKTSS